MTIAYDPVRVRERVKVALSTGFIGSTWRDQTRELIALIPVLLDELDMIRVELDDLRAVLNVHDDEHDDAQTLVD
jgi:hypothetical protein